VVGVAGTEARHHVGSRPDDVVETMAHDLISPLNLARGYAATLLHSDDALTPEQRRRYLQGMDRAVARAVQMIRALADLPRLEADMLHLDLEPACLIALARRVVSDIQRQCVEHVITLQHDDWLPSVSVDQDKIERVLANIITNAIKYSPAGEDVSVLLRDCAERSEAAEASRGYPNMGGVVVEVADKGGGIPEDELENVFEKYYRVENQLTRSIPGMGLGLYVSRLIVEAHGGRIWVRSTIGEGSVFGFSVPSSRFVV